ncbi:MAG: thioredoxin domain-containing protein [Flavobacteriales bacterium]
MNKKANRLIHSTSPYLLQHAYNPVDWYAWGEDAFQKATDENKLVLVSIGYSACHWCHVMEHEVFEDGEAAQYMNDHFVCIKVDREERPDVDHLYMDAVHLMGQQGGWPLNVFVLPDGRPIFGGTYFPKHRWLGVLESLVSLAREDEEKMESYAKALEKGLYQLENFNKAGSNLPDKDTHNRLIIEWMNTWDMEKGGTRRAPKFPMPAHIDLALHFGVRTGDADALEYVYTTLNKMAQGGIYDQVGGGFARYSVDDIWKVPHFEKMLYDNGQLISTYAKAFRHSKNPMYSRIIQETIDFIQREWHAPNGLIMCASDADSEGVEGKYYVWNKSELEQILGEDFPIAEEVYHVDHQGFWEHNNYILMRRNSDTEQAEKWEKPIEHSVEIINRINARLSEKRKERVAPSKDTKTITSWNALYIKGLAEASIALSSETYLSLAEKLFETLKQEHDLGDQGLIRNKDGQGVVKAFLEDYSTLIDASIHLFYASDNSKYLLQADIWTQQALEKFGDKDKALLWFSRRDPLILSRKKEVIDNVISSSNAIMAVNLFQLSRLMGNTAYEERAIRMLNEVKPQIDHAGSYTLWLMLQEWLISGFQEIILTGPEALDWKKDLNSRFLPSSIFATSTTDSSLPVFEGRIGTVTACYVCKNKTCSLPFDTLEAARAAISQ